MCARLSVGMTAVATMSTKPEENALSRSKGRKYSIHRVSEVRRNWEDDLYRVSHWFVDLLGSLGIWLLIRCRFGAESELDPRAFVVGWCYCWWMIQVLCEEDRESKA